MTEGEGNLIICQANPDRRPRHGILLRQTKTISKARRPMKDLRMTSVHLTKNGMYGVALELCNEFLTLKQGVDGHEMVLHGAMVGSMMTPWKRVFSFDMYILPILSRRYGLSQNACLALVSGKRRRLTALQVRSE